MDANILLTPKCGGTVPMYNFIPRLQNTPFRPRHSRKYLAMFGSKKRFLFLYPFYHSILRKSGEFPLISSTIEKAQVISGGMLQ